MLVFGVFCLFVLFISALGGPGPKPHDDVHIHLHGLGATGNPRFVPTTPFQMKKGNEIWLLVLTQKLSNPNLSSRQPQMKIGKVSLKNVKICVKFPKESRKKGLQTITSIYLSICFIDELPAMIFELYMH